MEMSYHHHQGNFGYNDRNNSNRAGSHNDIDLLRSKYKPGGFRVFHDFYKTKMCNLFLLNICKKGENCPFAHSDDEIREKPNLHKTKLCQAFLEEGKCSKGKGCSFAHGEEELRSTPDLFKTAICNLWTQGRCNSGERCRFAHGPEDLRPAPLHYKPRKNNFNSDFNDNTPPEKETMTHQNFNQHYKTPQSFPSFPQRDTFEYFMYPEVNVSEHFQDSNIVEAFVSHNKIQFSHFEN